MTDAIYNMIKTKTIVEYTPEEQVCIMEFRMDFVQLKMDLSLYLIGNRAESICLAMSGEHVSTLMVCLAVE